MMRKKKYCVRIQHILYSRSVTHARFMRLQVTTRARSGRDAVLFGSIGEPGESFTSSWGDNNGSSEERRTEERTQSRSEEGRSYARSQVRGSQELGEEGCRDAQARDGKAQRSGEEGCSQGQAPLVRSSLLNRKAG